jgi:hypothetical protein
MNSNLETAAVVGLSWFSGALATAFVAGPVGWIGGPALLAAGEFYRRKQRLGFGDVSLGVAQFTWHNAIAATQVMSGEAEAMVPVYANVVQKAKTLVDHGVQRPEVDLVDWVSNKGELRSLIIAGLPGEGKTHTAKALIHALLQVFPERYLKICTLDRGLSHDDEAPETWLGLDDDFFAEQMDDIRQEIEAAEAEMEQRYQDAKKGQPVNKYPYIVFIDELVATMGMLKTGNKQYDDAVDKTLKNLLVRGPKARVWIMGATQMLDCNGTGMNQAVLKLFEFLVFPNLGMSATSWRNLPDVAEQKYIIQELQGAPQKAPKPVAVLRGGRGHVMTMPRIEIPDAIPVIEPGDEIEQWLDSQADAIAVAVAEGLSATKAWDRVDVPKGVTKSKLKTNDWWQRFRMRHAEMGNTGNGTRKSEPGRTDEDP